MSRTPSIDRDRALRRLRRATAVALAAGGALVAAFAGLAAKALPGHHTANVTTVRVRAASSHVAATPPPLIAAQSAVPPAPAASAAPPVQTQAAPVVVSGGT